MKPFRAIFLLGAGCFLSAAAGAARELPRTIGRPVPASGTQFAGQALYQAQNLQAEYLAQASRMQYPAHSREPGYPEQHGTSSYTGHDMPSEQTPQVPPAEQMQQAELTAKADAAAREMLLGPTAELNVGWLREEVNPILRERREIRRMMAMRAAQAAQQAQSPAPAEDPHLSVGNWRLSVGNTSNKNMSPYPDRMLDARTLRFPMRRDSKADKRPESVKALERLRQK